MLDNRSDRVVLDMTKLNIECEVIIEQPAKQSLPSTVIQSCSASQNQNDLYCVDLKNKEFNEDHMIEMIEQSNAETVEDMIQPILQLQEENASKQKLILAIYQRHSTNNIISKGLQNYCRHCGHEFNKVEYFGVKSVRKGSVLLRETTWTFLKSKILKSPSYQIAVKQALSEINCENIKKQAKKMVYSEARLLLNQIIMTKLLTYDEKEPSLQYYYDQWLSDKKNIDRRGCLEYYESYVRTCYVSAITGWMMSEKRIQCLVEKYNDN